MAKKEYFSHDYHARDHLRDVRKDYGLEGLGFYWCIIEILHENGGYIKESDVEAIAYDLRANQDMAKDVLYKYKMFQIKKGKIFSQRVVDNINKREEISAKRRASANTRWEKEDSEIPLITIGEEEHCEVQPEEMKKSREFYADNIEKAFNRWLDNASGEELLRHNCYDYRQLFEAVVQEVREKDILYINGQKVPAYYYLYVLQRLIKNDTQNLDKALSDVEKRYASGKVKNKLQYIISALYNAARLDTL